jgi:hypothetical protein
MQIVSDDQHVTAQFNQLDNDGMVHYLLWNVHVNLNDCICGFCSNGLPANFEVAVNVTNVTRFSIFSLLNDRIKVCPEAVDKSTLGTWRSRFGEI